MKSEVEETRTAARERLAEGLSVSAEWASRRALCPPAAAASLLPSADECATALYVSGLLNGRLLAGVWPKVAAPCFDLLASTHVYCVANAPLDHSLSAHHTVREHDESPHPALIKCSAIHTRTPQQLALLRGHSYTPPNSSSSTNGPPPVKTEAKVERCADKTASSTVTTNVTAKSKSNIIAGLFARQKTLPKPKTSPPITPPVKIETVPNDQVKQKTSNGVKKSKTTNKKRKRIQAIESDDSNDSHTDDIFEKEPEEPPPVIDFNEEDEIPPTPEVPKRKRSPERHSQKRRRDKTYMGEDGYFHTIKNVMCSDDETVDDQKENSQSVNKCEEIPNTPEDDKKLSLKNENKTVDPVKTKGKSKSKLETKKSSPPNQQGKQSNIMNFFKKK